MNRRQLAHHMAEPVIETIRGAQKPQNQEERIMGTGALSLRAVGRVVRNLEDIHHARASKFTSSLFLDCMIIALRTETARELSGELIEAPAHRQGLIGSRAALTAPAKLPGFAESSVLMTGPARDKDAVTVRVEPDGVPFYRWNDTIVADIEALVEAGKGCPAMSIEAEFEGIAMPLHEAVWCEYVNWWTSPEL